MGYTVEDYHSYAELTQHMSKICAIQDCYGEFYLLQLL